MLVLKVNILLKTNVQLAVVKANHIVTTILKVVHKEFVFQVVPVFKSSYNILQHQCKSTNVYHVKQQDYISLKRMNTSANQLVMYSLNMNKRY